MKRHVTLIDPTSGSSVDAILDAPDDADGREVQAILERLAPAPGTLYLGPDILQTDRPLGRMGVGDGAFIGCGRPVASPRITAPTGTSELRVVGGAGAGTVFPLADGTWELGRGDVDLRVGADEFLSRRHVRVAVVGGSVRVVDLGSSNGTLVDGARIEDVELRPGMLLRAGNSLVELASAAGPELSLIPEADGTLGINRRFRGGDDELAREVAFPTPPTGAERPSLNLALTIAPAIAAGAMALFLHEVRFLLFAVLGPLMGIGNALARRRAHAKRAAAAQTGYEAELAAAQARLADLRKEEARRSRAESPDLAAIVQCARAAQRQLWARRPDHDDFLRLRVGSASRRSAVDAAGAPGEAEEDLWMAPLTVELPAVGGLAVIGHDVERARGVARAALLQAVTLHSPAELRVIVLANGGTDAWGWTRWLPHARWASDEPFCLVGADPATIQARVSELRELIKRRQEMVLRQRQAAAFLPAILVVYDNVAELLPMGIADLLRDGPLVGVHAIAVDRAQVPEGCNSSITLSDRDDEATFEAAGRKAVEHVLVDAAEPYLCDIVARCLAPLRLVGEEARNELPQSLRLLDLLQIDGPDAGRIKDLWAAGTRRAAAPVGLTANGSLVIDLTRDGPHAVIAGASRSGKSEYLKTLIASLAATNHPDDLSFIFIDFKGGNDYQLAARLPHTVDLATQQDRAGFERSLRLLDAEIVRRQQVCLHLQTSTLEGYWAAQARSSETTPKLGRLVVIVDEFAELAQKSPEQIDRLVSVARVGAAYGVHLLLATQNPAGVVSGQIDANAPLRVCFRTTQPEHSSEVLGIPDAAQIAERHRGRGFKRAHGEPPLEFQCARVGNARPGSTTVPASAQPWGWAQAGYAPPVGATVGEVPDPETDFYDLVEAIRKAAEASGWESSAVPWPKPLPQLVGIDDVAGVPAGSIPFALEDDPEQQARIPRGITLGQGHVAIAGAGGTGRTSALRAFAASAARTYPVSMLHIYGIDFRGGGLAAINPLPHVAGVASADPELATRVLDHLDGELRRRRGAFEQSGASSLPEHNDLLPDATLPWLALLVDGWEVLHEEAQTAAGSGLYDRLLKVLGDGQRLGLHAIVAGDRWVATGKAGRLMSHRFVLRFELESDVDSLGLRSSALPGHMPPGRAVDPDLRVYQIAVLGDGTGAGQAAALTSLAQELEARDAAVMAERRPTRISPLPAEVALAPLLVTAPAGLHVPSLLGLSAATSGPKWVDLATEAPTFLVGGRRRSGRSTALLAIASSAAHHGVRVVAVAPKPSPVQSMPAAHAVLDRDALASTDLVELVVGAPTLLVIDDIDLLDPNDSQLTRLAERAGRELVIVVAGASEHLRSQITGFLPLLRRSRAGMLLSPESPYDAGVLGLANFSRNQLFDGPPGRAVVALAGETDLVQVALPD